MQKLIDENNQKFVNSFDKKSINMLHKKPKLKQFNQRKVF